MIKVDSERTEIKGTKPEIMTELTVLLNTLMSKDIGFTENDILDTLKVSKMSEKDLLKKKKETEEEIKSMVDDFFEELFSDFGIKKIDFPHKRKED